MRIFLIILLIPIQVFANCNEYYLSLDFGGPKGDGPEIVDFLVKKKIPHVIFMVGYNINSDPGIDLCNKIRSNPEYKKYVKVGNHTLNHQAFKKTDKNSYVEEQILGNQAAIISDCTSENFVKVFRYPRGQSHSYAEQVLKKNQYISNFSKYSDEKFRTENAIGWTADTRDWVAEGAASDWAQNYYYNKNNKFMPVNKKSAESFKTYVMELDENNKAKKAFNKGLVPETFNSKEHKVIDGWHGPTKDAIVDRIMQDKGVDGKCVPLTHFGGQNTFEAIKEVVEQIDNDKFRMLDNSYFNLKKTTENILITLNPKELDISKDISPKKCVFPNGNAKKHIVKSGETLFGIANRYSIPIDQIKKLNNLSSDEIDIDQELKLQPDYVIHKVVQSETLYRISKTYDVDYKDILKWNKLKSSEIEIGQELIIMR